MKFLLNFPKAFLIGSRLPAGPGICFSTAVLTMLFCPVLSARENDIPEERIAKMENIVSKLPQIYGFVNMRYQYSDADGSNGFDIRRARIDFRGDIVRSFGYRLQAELAGAPRILDAYFEWKPSSYFNVLAGQQKIPFSLENPYGPHTLETIDNSQVITALCGYNDVSGISANGRDVGVDFYGGFFKRESHYLIRYTMGIFSGNGINTTDGNKAKDFSGTLSVNPTKALTLSVFHHNGTSGLQEETHQRIRSGGGIKYDNGKLLVRSEYIQGKSGATESEGWYGVLAYFIHSKVQPLLKYDYFQRDKSLKETRSIHYLVGVNYSPAKNIRLQMNYAYRTLVGSKNVNYIAIQLFGLFR